MRWAPNIKGRWARSPSPLTSLGAGRLPCLHYIDERPDRNSTSRPRNSASSALQTHALRPVAGRFPTRAEGTCQKAVLDGAIILFIAFLQSRSTGARWDIAMPCP
jgi:hypothetical protein